MVAGKLQLHLGAAGGKAQIRRKAKTQSASDGSTSHYPTTCADLARHLAWKRSAPQAGCPASTWLVSISLPAFGYERLRFCSSQGRCFAASLTNRVRVGRCFDMGSDHSSGRATAKSPYPTIVLNSEVERAPNIRTAFWTTWSTPWGQKRRHALAVRQPWAVVGCMAIPSRMYSIRGQGAGA